MPSGGLQAVFGRGVAHPPAVAWRVVHKRVVDGLTYEEICQELQPMSIGSVHNILVRFQASGNVEARQGENALGPPNMIMTYGRVATLLESMLANEAAGDGDEMLQEIYADFSRAGGGCRRHRHALQDHSRPWLQPEQGISGTQQKLAHASAALGLPPPPSATPACAASPTSRRSCLNWRGTEMPCLPTASGST